MGGLFIEGCVIFAQKKQLLVLFTRFSPPSASVSFRRLPSASVSFRTVLPARRGFDKSTRATPRETTDGRDYLLIDVRYLLKTQ